MKKKIAETKLASEDWEERVTQYAEWMGLPESVFDSAAVKWLDQHDVLATECLIKAVRQKLWEKPVADQTRILDACMQNIMTRMDADMDRYEQDAAAAE